jgi:hypothetical protein
MGLPADHSLRKDEDFYTMWNELVASQVIVQCSEHTYSYRMFFDSIKLLNKVSKELEKKKFA